MIQQHALAGSRSGKALVAMLLLAGVFAMHGLTGNHDAAMSLRGHSSLSTASEHNRPYLDDQPLLSDQALMLTAPAGSTIADGDPVASAMHSDVPRLTARGLGASGNDEHRSAMGDVCLAMLVALLLALLVALARRSVAVTYPARPVGGLVAMTATGPSPPWMCPTLSKLCILRT